MLVEQQSEDREPPGADQGRYVRTVDRRPGANEMIKPGEMIDIRGKEKLSLADQRIYNQLVANAFGPEMAEDGHEWTIRLSELRGGHKGNERISKSIERLMTTVVTTKLHNGKIRRFQLLGGNDMDDEDREDGALRYSFDKRLIAVLRDSFTFGKLELAVMKAFTSRYALALWEYGAKRVNLDWKSFEEFSLEEFRSILGVPEGTLKAFGSLKQKAIDPALQEVNYLAEFEMWVKPIKTGRKVTGVAVGWDWKDREGQHEAFRELRRPRVGRKARMRSEVAQLEAVA